MKIILIVCAVVLILRFIFNVIKSLFYSIKNFSKKNPPTPSYSLLNKIGNCAKCGKKDHLSNFEGKKYCAFCYARLYAEKKCSVNKTDVNPD